mmetsp:Transcript_4046/g.7726  ORF Transcript_4046/g.7726 Transcript_4046/m.7726 type:complete len:219 (+) Transcript_4046:51-707(+)
MKALLPIASLLVLILATTITTTSALFVPRQQQQQIQQDPNNITTTKKRWTTRVRSALSNSNPLSSDNSSSSSVGMLVVDAACIGVGAVTGAVCRYQIGNIVTRKIQERPSLSYFAGWHTAGINIVGSFVLGTLAGMPTVDPAAASLDHHRGITARSRLCMGVGFCGSFTTFSTFSVDVATMLGKGEMTRAFSYLALNNVGGVMAAFAGFNVAKRILSR